MRLARPWKLRFIDMRSEREIRGDFLDALQAEADNDLGRLGFKRRIHSLRFSRSGSDVIHGVTFIADFFPRYQIGAEAHIHPMMSVEMPAVSRRALELVGGDRMLLANAPEVIINQPVEFAAPKDKRVRWFAAGRGEFDERVRAIVAFLRSWTIPLLDELTTPESLVDAYERQEERLIRQRHWYLFVAAAFELTGSPGQARQVLEDQLGTPGLRKRYAAAFQRSRL